MRSTAIIAFLSLAGAAAQQPPRNESIPPRTWDSQALENWATPLAGVNFRPGHFSEDEYYRTPIDNYRTYPVYLPEKEPAGYWDELRRKQPEPLIQPGRRDPAFNWIAAGKRVWDEIDVPIFRLYDAESISMVRSAEYMRKNRDKIVILADGTSAIYRWVVTPRGMALSVTACSSCHTRVLQDGTTLAGPGLARLTSDPLLDRTLNRLLLTTYAGDSLPISLYRQFGVPWLPGDVHGKLKTMSGGEIARLFEALPPGVSDRPNGSVFYPTKIPDLIGILDRKYIDHTATHQHRGSGDLMRYAALVEFSDSMDFGSHRMLSEGQRKMHVRWPDEALYAMAQYIYSLRPPPNPNPNDAAAAEGETVFREVGCGVCHTPPLYTNNKLTLAEGFHPPHDHPLAADIMEISVGTDANLALRTRKGTGLYKVPSLKGVWYRRLYGHDGAVSSLEDWFDRARLRDDFVPGGFKGAGVHSRAVPGHEFGLDLSARRKKALIAFLKTL